MLQLLWCKYESDGKSRNIVVVELGIKNGLLYCLLNEKLSRSDVTLIKQATKLLGLMDVTERLDWINQQCVSAKGALRTLSPNRLVIMQTYPIKSH